MAGCVVVEGGLEWRMTCSSRRFGTKRRSREEDCIARVFGRQNAQTI